MCKTQLPRKNTKQGTNLKTVRNVFFASVTQQGTIEMKSGISST